MTISSYCTFRSAGCNVFIADDIIYADGKILRYRREIYRFDICPVQIQRHTVAGGEKLSAREKEIIRLVAHGLANKEIADRLCLSFHTVTTYRKNISSKLNIHSTAALTIYAILQGIADPKDIELK